ncbi:carboxypeptidase-like regulatory domain-containing protein [Bizionia sediminis]|uniref:Carboxypeptidase-like regulatory domain-containing protein n=1 Tax=Bizionia sediminis TaxID=1737064 RepID=A0ABW5KTF9_9FLAO
MKHLLFIFSFVLLSGSIMGQNMKRVLVAGIVVASNDVEGVTIFNVSSNKGAVADINGNFTLEVAVNDILEVSALQYETRRVTITEHVITEKKLRLFLVEALNTLSEVLLLPEKLTGVLLADINDAKVQRAIAMNFGNLGYLEFGEDPYTKPENIATDPGVFYNGINFASILGINKWLNGPLKKTSLQQLRNQRPLDLADIYTTAYIHETYSIPENQVEAFIAFCLAQGFDASLLEVTQDMQRMEFLQKHSELFLNQPHEP